jgi:hypothetical protein
MQSRTPRATGILARLRARLRGDRFMVDAYPPAAAAPERRPDPGPVPSRESRREEG